MNYSEDMVAGQLVAGLANDKQKAKILAEANTLTTLEQKFSRLVSLEMTDKSTPHLQSSIAPPTTFVTLRSKQKRWFEVDDTPEIPPQTACKGCGGRSHPKGRKNCPAAKQQCFKCGLVGHLGRVCRKPKKVPTTESTSQSIKHRSVVFCNKDGNGMIFSGRGKKS